MILHLLKLVWNRKRVNGMIVIEIGIAFLVLCAVMTWGVYYWNLYNQPMGFSDERVWEVRFNRPVTTQSRVEDEATIAARATIRQLLDAVRAFDKVAVADIAPSAVPRSGATWTSGLPTNDERYHPFTSEAGDNFDRVMGLEIVQGRWFEAADAALNWRPVVINRRFSEAIFGTDDPLGKPFGTSGDHELRVVGVISDYRKRGEFGALSHMVVIRFDWDDYSSPYGSFLLKLRPGTPGAFEETLMTTLQSIAPTYQFRVMPLEQYRREYLQDELTPLVMMALIAGFLIVMVGLGLVGVLWQNVTQRTAEIGLRRAVGGSARRIHTQILGELFVITTLGVLLGMLIAAQFPLLDIIGGIPAGVYLASLGLSLLVVYVLTGLAGLYPSRLATRVHPAAALHYE